MQNPLYAHGKNPWILLLSLIGITIGGVFLIGQVLAFAEGYVGTTLIYQLSDSVTARATVEQADGSATPTSAEDVQANQDQAAAGARTSVSIDWRFAPNWLLRGTLGVGEQASSGLDVLYQFRY